MHVIKTVEEMKTWSKAQRQSEKKIALVPTMGALHEGHLSLIHKAKKHADVVVLSIYVNPIQFGPGEDLSHYPRDLDGDLEKAKSLNVDAVFLPSDEIMYPKGYKTYVNVGEITERLCGASRPGHFRGVTTIVVKLFNIVAPHVAVFGEKDFQQLVIIRKMTADLNLPVEILSAPTVREDDGLALSSRNKYLSMKEREAALSISRSLTLAQNMVNDGEKEAAKIIAKTHATIEATGIGRIDYVKLVDADTLTDIARLKRPALLAIAAFFGKTRLIDNCFFSLSSPNDLVGGRDDREFI